MLHLPFNSFSITIVDMRYSKLSRHQVVKTISKMMKMSFSGLNCIIHMNYMPRWSNQIVWRASFFSVVGKYSTDTKTKKKITMQPK